MIILLSVSLVYLYNRVPRDLKEVEDPGVHDQNNNEWVWKSG